MTSSRVTDASAPRGAAVAAGNRIFPLPCTHKPAGSSGPASGIDATAAAVARRGHDAPHGTKLAPAHAPRPALASGRPAGSAAPIRPATRLPESHLHPFDIARPERGTTDGNRAELFDDGEALFEAKAEAIRAARERVWVETFLFTPDETGRAILGLLRDAAGRGCDVVLLYDHAGGHVTNFGFFRPVEEAGGRVGIFNPLPPWRSYGRRLGSILKHRDHRKIVIADGVGFCGGHNVTTEYMGPPPHGFYDMSVRLEGPCVRDLASVFLDSFRAVTGELRPLPSTPPPIDGGVPARALAHDGTREVNEIVPALRAALDGAREEVLLVFAYFQPDRVLAARLIAAAERGVRVTLLTTGKTDLPPVRLARQHTYDRLLEAGLRIFHLEEPKLHAKAMVVDRELCMVGTFDVNQLQRRNTAEVAVMLKDRNLAERIIQGFRSCLPRSREVTLADRKNRSGFARLAERVAYRLIR
jgi:cardiolipin synthase A/B